MKMKSHQRYQFQLFGPAANWPLIQDDNVCLSRLQPPDQILTGTHGSHLSTEQEPLCRVSSQTPWPMTYTPPSAGYGRGRHSCSWHSQNMKADAFLLFCAYCVFHISRNEIFLGIIIIIILSRPVHKYSEFGMFLFRVVKTFLLRQAGLFILFFWRSHFKMQNKCAYESDCSDAGSHLRFKVF